MAESDYRKATRANTVPAYKDFLTRFPVGERSEQARKAIVTIMESDYREAERLNTVSAYQHFIAQYPAGALREKAQNHLDALSFAYAENKDTAEEYAKYLNAFPQGKHRTEAKKGLAARLGRKVRLVVSVSANCPEARGFLMELGRGACEGYGLKVVSEQQTPILTVEFTRVEAVSYIGNSVGNREKWVWLQGEVAYDSDGPKVLSERVVFETNLTLVTSDGTFVRSDESQGNCHLRRLDRRYENVGLDKFDVGPVREKVRSSLNVFLGRIWLAD